MSCIKILSNFYPCQCHMFSHSLRHKTSYIFPLQNSILKAFKLFIFEFKTQDSSAWIIILKCSTTACLVEFFLYKQVTNNINELRLDQIQWGSKEWWLMQTSEVISTVLAARWFTLCHALKQWLVLQDINGFLANHIMGSMQSFIISKKI